MISTVFISVKTKKKKKKKIERQNSFHLSSKMFRMKNKKAIKYV